MNVTEELLKTMALSLVPNLGPMRFKKGVEVFGDACGFFDAPPGEWVSCGIFGLPRTLDKLALLEQAWSDLKKAAKHPRAAMLDF